MDFAGFGMERNKIEPLIMKQLLKDGVLVNDGRQDSGRMFDDREQAHGLVIVKGPVVHGL